MTTFAPFDVVCTLCGRVTEQYRITSTSIFGPPDLDLRPGPLKRSTMYMWLQQCRHCRYVSPDLSQPEQGAAEIVTSREYHRVGMGWDPQARAVPFLRRSILDEAFGDPLAAGEHALWAAWACDDARDRDVAAEMRLRSAGLFRHALTTRQLHLHDQMTLKIRLVDIHRRAGQWGEAVALADEVLSIPELEAFQRSVVAFGRAAADRGDRARYTIGDVNNGSGAGTADNGGVVKPSTASSPKKRPPDPLSFLANIMGRWIRPRA
jgi:hypothetical protein